jgi:CO/xanthine dehydrogenase Mo-binding subunit
VEVELDPVTLKPQCKCVWVSLGAVYDAERRSAEAEVEAAVIKELSAATLEILNESEDISKRCLTYSPLEMPLVEVNFLTSSESGAAATGFGDQAVTCLTPAFSAAVSQAMGVSINRIPVTPEILDSMQEE